MAFVPVKTLSGASMPVLTKQVSGAAVAKGKLVKKGAGAAGKWTVTSANDPQVLADSQLGYLGVSLNATTGNAVAGEYLDVCLCSPDVVFEAPIEGAIAAVGHPMQIDPAGEIKAAAAAAGAPGAFVLGQVDPSQADGAGVKVYFLFHTKGYAS